MDFNNFDLFISHASENKEEIAKLLLEYLNENGIKSWYDEESIQYGDRISQKVFDGLKKAKGVIVLYTKFYNEKKWTLSEFGVACYKNLYENGPLYILDWQEVELPNLAFIKDIKSLKKDNFSNLKDIANEITLDYRKKEKYLQLYKCPDGLKRITPRLKKTILVEQVPVNRFTDFLESINLKYLSRGEFKNHLSSEEQKSFYSEKDLLEFLFSKDKYGLIIHGQGGIGKTRLMLELGKRLANNDFIVLQVVTEFKNVNDLKEYIKIRPEKKYILLFDYIEVQTLFDEIANWIINENFKNIKIIGNCRNTFVSEVQNSFHEEDFKFIDIGFKDKIGNEVRLEKRYKQAIILSIINSISDLKLSTQLRKDAVLQTFYKARPSFAAFIKYLYLKNPEGFNISISDSFHKWLIKKIKLTILKEIKCPSFYEEKVYIFQLLSCLPSNPNATEKLEEKYKNDINNLIKDGWVDEIDKNLIVVHDSVVDSLLIEFFNNFQYNETYLKDFLKFSLENDSISSMLYSLQRLMGEIQWNNIPKDKKIKFQQVIAKFIDNNLNDKISKEDWFKYKIDTSQMICENDRIDLIIKHKNLLKELISHVKFGNSLAFSMEWVHENIIDEEKKIYYSTELKKLFFNEWNIDGRFNDFVEDYKAGNIISCYINLNGIDDFIKERFFEYIEFVRCSVSELESISFALVSWLRCNGIITQDLNNLIQLWFNVYSKEQPDDVNPGPLMTIWIEKGDDINLVRKTIELILTESLKKIEAKANFLGTWLKYSNDTEFVEPFILDILKGDILPNTAIFIISYWLEKSNKPLKIKSNLRKWLNFHVEYQLFSRIIKNWLNSGDEPNILVEPIKNWILNETNQNSIGYILGYYISMDGNINELKKEILIWLKQNCSNTQSVFVLGHLLEKSNDKDLILELEITTIEIVKNFVSLTETGFVICNWLTKDGKLSVVESYIDKWLKIWGISELGCSIISYWLSRNGDCIIVKGFIISCIENIKVGINTALLIRAWLEFGDDPYLVNKYVKSHFQPESNFEDRYLITTWLEKTVYPYNLFVKNAIKSWLAKFGNQKESNYVSYYWLKYGDDIRLVDEYIKYYFYYIADQKNSNNTMEYWIKNGGDINIIEKCIEIYVNKRWNNINTLYLSTIWLRHTNKKSTIKYYIQHYLHNYSKYKDCYDIISLWLSYKGDNNIIRPILKKYLEFNWQDEHAIILIKTWIVRTNSIDEVKEFVTKIIYSKKNNPFESYLEIKNNSINVKENIEKQWKKDSFIRNYNKLSIRINKYLSSDIHNEEKIKSITDLFINYGIKTMTTKSKFSYDRNFMKYFLNYWLNENLFKENDSYLVISVALSIDNGFNIVRVNAIKWLKKFGKTNNAKYLLSSWLKIKGNENVAEIDKWIVFWFENLYDPTKFRNWRDDLLFNYVVSLPMNKE